MKMRKIFFILILFLITSPIAMAIEDTKEIKDTRYLVDCINVGVYNNPTIKHVMLRYKMAKNNVGLAKSEYFPTIGANVSVLQKYNSNNL